MVSENFARELWLSPAAALGKRIREGAKDEWREIIGVVGDVRHDGADQKAPATIYWPVAMSNFWGNEKFLQRRSVYAIRTDRAGSQALTTQIRQVVWSVVPDVPIVSVRTMEEVYRGSMARSSFTLVMLGIAGGMALLLGIVGIYGVISYAVSQRTREIGIRMALGAQREALTAMFVRQGLWLTGIGIVFGVAAAFGTMRLMSSLLFNVSTKDPWTYGVAIVSIIAISWIACYVPSRRAAAVDPTNALRAE